MSKSDKWRDRDLTMTQADQIRLHAARYVDRARQGGRDTVTIRAGDIGRDLDLNKRIPAVCSALGSKVFLEQEGLRLLERKGPRQSTTTEFRYTILDTATERSAKDRGASPLRRADEVVRNFGVILDRNADSGLYLVSCVKTKRSKPAPAKDLYTSPWFRKARACVERKGCPWRILSAKYGLVDPETIIRPYERTLKTMSVAERREWAKAVLDVIGPSLIDIDTVIFLAGQDYREFLEPELRDRGLTVIVPMAGLSQGKQLSWLGRCLHD